jgi:hypothetical protein
MKLYGWKRAAISGLMLCALFLPVWAQGSEPDRDKGKHHHEVPEGGSGPVYVIVSGAAILGSLLLVRRQRSSKHLQNES